jgi:AcrB/AcrD/AcrF family
VLGAVLVFFVLAGLYESWSLPLAVILVVPMCVLSALAGIALAQMDVNIFVQVGLSVTVLSRVRRHASSAPLACILPGDRRGGVAPGGHGTASSYGDHCHGSS